MSSRTAAPPSGTRRELRDWLERHEQQCLSSVETWMTRSLPVAGALAAAVWPDPAWQDALRNLVVWPVDERAAPERECAGFLAGASPERGIGLITLDGETTWLQEQAVGIPHPVLLQDLEDFREFATELGLEQRLSQLYREVWSKPTDAAAAQVVTSFAGGSFRQLLEATNRARSLGYAIRGGSAICRVWDEAQAVEARYWLGDDAPVSASVTGNLEWVARDGRSLRLGQLSEVAYSEGMRMAALIYAARAPEEQAA